MSFILTAIIMFVFWILLSGEFTLILLLSGGIFSLMVAYMCHGFFIGDADLKLEAKRIYRLIKYLPWLLWQIVISNIDVTLRTLNPKLTINPSIVTFKNDLNTNMGIVTLSNSITLTPGTVTIKAGKDEFIVHAIDDKFAKALIEGEMQRRVKKIEGDESV
ncbi:MAG: Na+/H+ antiporter subunit E [Candidatus Anammoxibacter sp.]